MNNIYLIFVASLILWMVSAQKNSSNSHGRNEAFLAATTRPSTGNQIDREVTAQFISFSVPSQFCAGLPMGQFCNVGLAREVIACPASVSSMCPMNSVCQDSIQVDIKSNQTTFKASWYD